MSVVDEQVETYQKEVLRMAQKVAAFGKRASDDCPDGVDDLGEILRHIAGFRSRTSWIKLHLSQSQVKDRRYSQLIHDMLIPFLEELTEQYRIWSRIITNEQFELEMSRG